MPENNSVLWVNDSEDASRYFREKLTIDGGYLVTSESTVTAGLETFKQNSFDIVIVKLDMPDSLWFVKELKRLNPDCVIIVFLQEGNPDIVKEISGLGIYDVIHRHTDSENLFFLIKKGIELHLLKNAHRKLVEGLQEHNASLQKQNTLLAKRIEESTKNLTRLYEDLRSTYMRTIKVLAQAIDTRDHYTHDHSENVAKYAVVIASEMGLAAKDIEMIREACELHDLGKIGIEDSILSKDSELTPGEWEQIKRHPSTGAQILEPLTFLGGVIDLVRQHHEHYDGSGYPDGRRGEDILLGARIIHLADAFESMRSVRSYRKIPFSKEEAISEIKRNSGTQFDPKVVGAFLNIVDKLQD